MSLHKLRKELLTRLTRQPVLVVHSERILRTSVRSVLRGIGGTNVHVAGSYAEALEAMGIRSFSYVLFENSKDRSSTPAEFARKATKLNAGGYLIAMFEPAYLEDLFTCLQAGVRGFVVIPCTPDALEETLIKATEGLNIPTALLEAESADVIFARFVLKQLEAFCSAVKSSREDPQLVAQVEIQIRALREAVHMGRAYSEGGDQALLHQIMAQCMNTASDKRTRLARIREQLAKERGQVSA